MGDDCGDWFHGRCVNLTQAVGDELQHYLCPLCSEKKGVPYLYSAENKDAAIEQEDKAVENEEEKPQDPVGDTSADKLGGAAATPAQVTPTSEAAPKNAAVATDAVPKDDQTPAPGNEAIANGSTPSVPAPAPT